MFAGVYKAEWCGGGICLVEEGKRRRSMRVQGGYFGTWVIMGESANGHPCSILLYTSIWIVTACFGFGLKLTENEAPA